MPRTTRQGQGLDDRRGARKGRSGQEPFVATQKERENVSLWSAYGHTYEWMCARIKRNGRPISEDTLVRHFRTEIDEGVKYANAELGGVLYAQAKSGNVRALEQWFDRKGGADWKRRTEQARTGADGGPIRYSDVSDEELDRRLRELEEKEKGNGSDSAQPTGED